MNNKKEMIFGMISKISGGDGGADVSGVTATAGDVDEGKIFVDSTGAEVEGTSTYKADYTALNTLVGQTTATQDDVDSGKLFVKSDGTQGTGSSTYKADYTALNTLVLGTTATQADVDSGKLFVQSDGTQGTGSSTYKADYTALNTLVGQTTATDGDVASGKLYVKADGTQGTGTSISGGADVSGVTATAADVATGKVFVNSNGTQVTGTNTSTADYITYLSRPTGEIIKFPVGATKIPDYAFYGTTSNPAGYVIPDTVTTIGNYAFNSEYLGNSLTLPDSITTIGSYAFSSSYISIATLPSNLRYINQYAFYHMYNLPSSLSIPANVYSIGGNAFAVRAGSNALKSVTFLGTPNTISNTAFAYVTQLKTIRVPWSSGAVSGAPWGATNATITYDYTP